MAEDERTPRRRRPGRLVLNLALVAAGLLVAYVVITFVQVWQASGDDDATAAEAIVVLGAAQYDGVPSPALAGRLNHAFDLYEAGVAPVIVVTGGNRAGDVTTEAKAGYDYLRGRGVPDASLLLEVGGTSTWQSLSATRRFLGTRGIDEVVLVSDPAHSLRLEGVADEVGFVAHISPTDAGAPFGSLLRETAAVSVGRVISYRRLEQLVS